MMISKRVLILNTEQITRDKKLYHWVIDGKLRQPKWSIALPSEVGNSSQARADDKWALSCVIAAR